jgi:hypothetical protein
VAAGKLLRAVEGMCTWTLDRVSPCPAQPPSLPISTAPLMMSRAYLLNQEETEPQQGVLLLSLPWPSPRSSLLAALGPWPDVALPAHNGHSSKQSHLPQPAMRYSPPSQGPLEAPWDPHLPRVSWETQEKKKGGN